MALQAKTRVEVYLGKDGYRFRVRAANGKIISTGEAYTRRHDCIRGARRANPGVVIVEVIRGRASHILAV